MKSAFKNFIVLFLAWTLFGVFFAAQGYANSLFFGRPAPFFLQLKLWLICGYGWLALTPAVHFFSTRFPIRRGIAGRHLVVQLVLAGLTSLVHLLLFVTFNSLVLGSEGNPFSFGEAFERLLFTNFHFDFLVYWALIGIFHLLEINRRFVERERETARLALATSQLETKLAEARLGALKSQLQPHFLFNTLNSISVLMRDDAAAANRMLVRLSELLRAALKSENSQKVPLHEELEFVKGYLEIEKTRFQERLTVDFAVGSSTLDAQIPNLLLQPLVENAVRHGIAPQADGGRIVIESKRSNGLIELSVSDNGAGLGGRIDPTNGIGLKNTRERLEKLYGSRQNFEIISAPGEGLRVRIQIPYER